MSFRTNALNPARIRGRLRCNCTLEHFEMEETLMRDAAYPDFGSHKALHDDLVQQINDLEQK